FETVRVLQALEESAQQPGEGGVRQILAVRRTGDGQPATRTRRRTAANGQRQRALANAHPAHDLDDGASAGSQRGKAGVDLFELSMATQVSLDARAPTYTVRLPEHDEAADRCVLAAYADRSTQAQPKGAPQIGPGRFADQDAAHRRGVLETSGHIDRIAHDGQ